MKTNKVTITGFAIGIIVLVLNIIIDIIVLNMALIVSTGITEQSSNIELYRWEGVGEPHTNTNYWQKHRWNYWLKRTKRN
ncbi:hypothetical protein M0C40_07655 [Spiroplasma citri]|uniref:Plectrovirus-related protein n=1 Tax=Spiroplasma citri TaxID=2133 RepID=A0AAX3SXC8_SPICI|nr:hypothetical protein [Spiroplasma citri]WFG95971.1 hypothetical protein M0C40_07655 [Spiroplasma citri]